MAATFTPITSVGASAEGQGVSSQIVPLDSRAQLVACIFASGTTYTSGGFPITAADFGSFANLDAILSVTAYNAAGGVLTFEVDSTNKLHAWYNDAGTQTELSSTITSFSCVIVALVDNGPDDE